MEEGKRFVLFGVLVILVAVGLAGAQSSLTVYHPLSEITGSQGTSIDSNNNGIVDYADDANKLGGILALNFQKRTCAVRGTAAANSKRTSMAVPGQCLSGMCVIFLQRVDNLAGVGTVYYQDAANAWVSNGAADINGDSNSVVIAQINTNMQLRDDSNSAVDAAPTMWTMDNTGGQAFSVIVC